MSDDERERLRARVVEDALEWVAAHDALTLGDPTGPADSDLLERYSDACNDLLAVVSQNRAALSGSGSTSRTSDGPAEMVTTARHVHEGQWCRPCVQHGSDVTFAGIAEAESARAASVEPTPPLDVAVMRRTLMSRELVVLDTRDYGGMRMSDTAAADAIATEYAAILAAARLADTTPESPPEPPLDRGIET